ncbi:MAG: MarR family transcriptional regulator [Alphaproteobacteria bacterium]|nr:MAG: MarR family transcriptional regulator [Alphaproteobacteria bacterium]
MDPGGCICASLRQAARAVTQAYDTALRPADLTATQFTVLATLTRHPDLPLTKLAQILVMDRTTLTRTLKPLVDKGLVRIEPGKDQRVRTVGLSEAGRARLAEALPLWRRAQTRLVERLGRTRWSGLLDDLAATVTFAQEQ